MVPGLRPAWTALEALPAPDRGDRGFDFGRGSSSHFVVAIVASPAPDAIHEAAAQVRRELRWPDDREFKFSGTHDDAKALYFQYVRRTNFTIHAIIFNKRALATASILGDFYEHLVGLSLSDLTDILRRRHLVLDESFKGKSKKRTFRTQLRTRLNRRGSAGSPSAVCRSRGVVGNTARVSRVCMNWPQQ